MQTNRRHLVELAVAGMMSVALFGGAAQAQGYYGQGNYGYGQSYYGQGYAQGYAAPAYPVQGYGQGYYGQSYYGQRPPAYGPPPASAYEAPETVIVRPYYDTIQTQQLLGRYDGQINPTRESISHPVTYSDLNLSTRAGRAQLRYRIRDTAENLCAALDDRDVGGPDRDSHRECVRDAVEDAMDQIR